MKNLLLIALFMFSASNFKQEKPVTDSINKPPVPRNIEIDTTAYILPETMPSDAVLKELKETNVIVKQAKIKAVQAMKNAEQHRVERQSDDAFKTLDNLPTKTD